MDDHYKDTGTEEARLLRHEQQGTIQRCEYCSHSTKYQQPQHPSWTLIHQSIVVFFVLCALGLVVAIRRAGPLARIDSYKESDNISQLYSPANHVLSHHAVRFNRSRGIDKTPFQGWPTDEIDATWDAAFMPGLLTIFDPETASRFPDPTEHFPKQGQEHMYMATLDIFHQMHCLNVVRQALYRDRYDKHFYRSDGSVDHCKWVHVDHCLDQVRQALMCAADVTVVPFEWSETVQGMRPRVDNMHVCRDYSKILDWAKERAIAASDWHPSLHVVEKHGVLEIAKGRNYAAESNPGECNAI